MPSSFLHCNSLWIEFVLAFLTFLLFLDHSGSKMWLGLDLGTYRNRVLVGIFFKLFQQSCYCWRRLAFGLYFEGLQINNCYRSRFRVRNIIYRILQYWQFVLFVVLVPTIPFLHGHNHFWIVFFSVTFCCLCF